MYHRQTGDPDDALTIPLPPVQLVDLRQELRAGNRSIFSRILQKELNETLARGDQAILFLNRRGTATFVMCRDCGFVLNCPRCDMPLTYHRPGAMPGNPARIHRYAMAFQRRFGGRLAAANQFRRLAQTLSRAGRAFC